VTSWRRIVAQDGAAADRRNADSCPVGRVTAVRPAAAQGWRRSTQLL